MKPCQEIIATPGRFDVGFGMRNAQFAAILTIGERCEGGAKRTAASLTMSSAARSSAEVAAIGLASDVLWYTKIIT